MSRAILVALGAFHLEEIEKNLDEANQFDKETRNAFARDLLLTYLQIEIYRDAIDGQEKLESLLSYSVARRHEALQAGATSRSDPLWNVSACMETALQTEILANRDARTRAIAKEVKKALSTFVDENLSPSEMRELRDFVVNSLEG